MLESLLKVGIVMDCEYRLWQQNEVMVDTLQIPHQHVKPIVRDIAKRARTKAAMNSRIQTTNLDEIDQRATIATL